MGAAGVDLSLVQELNPEPPALTKAPSLYQRRTQPITIFTKTMASPFISPLLPTPQAYPIPTTERTLDDLAAEVKRLFQQHLKTEPLLDVSKRLQLELKQHLVSSPQCMLPSFNYALPTGEEKGIYLALEVGGSNLRITLVELGGRAGCDTMPMRIRRAATYPIEKHVRQLEGLAFFDWMAKRIGDTLKLERARLFMREGSPPIPMGIAWSFPVELVGRKFIL